MGAPIWPAPTKATRKGLLSREAGGDGLDLGVLLQALDATLAAHAAGLVAPERRVGAVEDAAVHADDPGAQPLGDRHRAVVRPGDVPAEAVLVVVGEAHGVVV